MKKYLAGSLIILSCVFSCKKVDDSNLFGKSADQRVTEAVAEYQAKLTGATDGWKALIYTKAGGVYSFYFRFNDSNRVQMLSGFDSTSAVTLRESSYRVKALQQPSLIFDTYSYLHVLADPNGEVNGGVTGEGLVSDFEFYFADTASTNDVITLVGRFNKSKAVLTRATAQEASSFLNGELTQGYVINKILTYYKHIDVNGLGSIDVHQSGLFSGKMSAPDNLGNLMDSSRQSQFYFVLGGVAFSNPITVGSISINEITGMSWDPTLGVIHATINGQPATISSINPLPEVDTTAPKRWWGYPDGGNVYTSISGFHINGVDDYFNFRTKIPGLNEFDYYTDLNNNGYDGFIAFYGVYVHHAMHLFVV